MVCAGTCFHRGGKNTISCRRLCWESSRSCIPGRRRDWSFQAIPATLAPTKYTNFAPRLGLAYSPDFQTGLLGKIFGGPGKTSVRAGYGVFYTAFEGLSAGIMSANPPYGYDYNSPGGRPLFATPFVSAATGQSLGQPFPSPIPPYGASASNPNSAVDWSKYLPVTGVPSFYYRNVPPYSESYTLSLQRQLAADTVLTIGYVGAQAHHLLVLTSANPGNATLCLSVSQPDQVMPGSPTCGPFSEGGIFTRANGETVQVRGPFSSQFDGITYQKTIASSNYNALEISLRHNSRSLEVMAGYTYSKSLDDSSSLAEAVNPLDPGLSKALSAFDMRHNFVVSYQYKLPVGTILHCQNRWTKGWSLSGITRFSTGLPVKPYTTITILPCWEPFRTVSTTTGWTRPITLPAIWRSTPIRATANLRSTPRCSVCPRWVSWAQLRGASSTVPEWRISIWLCRRTFV